MTDTTRVLAETDLRYGFDARLAVDYDNGIVLDFCVYTKELPANSTEKDRVEIDQVCASSSSRSHPLVSKFPKMAPPRLVRVENLVISISRDKERNESDPRGCRLQAQASPSLEIGGRELLQFAGPIASDKPHFARSRGVNGLSTPRAVGRMHMAGGMSVALATPGSRSPISPLKDQGWRSSERDDFTEEIPDVDAAEAGVSLDLGHRGHAVDRRASVDRAGG